MGSQFWLEFTHDGGISKTMSSNERILALIPARMGSSRFPGKPMAELLGKPMIGHVFERVSECDFLSLTAVATCGNKGCWLFASKFIWQVF